MKNYYLYLNFLLILLLTTTSITAKNQDDDKVFPTDNALWSVYLFSRKPTVQYIYGLTGDTLINNITYSKLYLLNDSTLVIDENDIYVGGIRQENKVVYMQPATNKWEETLDEFVLYDFSKTVGEYITFSRTYEGPLDASPSFENVTRIWYWENIMIRKDEQTLYGRRVEPDIYMPQEWIEHIGSLSGFFFSPIDFADDGSSTWLGGMLTCMMENGQIRYMDKINCTSCFGPLRYDYNSYISHSSPNKSNVYYNKDLESITVQGVAFPLRFQLYSPDGNLLTDRIITEEPAAIDISSVKNRMFVYRISHGQTTETGKIIIY